MVKTRVIHIRVGEDIYVIISKLCVVADSSISELVIDSIYYRFSKDKMLNKEYLEGLNRERKLQDKKRIRRDVTDFMYDYHFVKNYLRRLFQVVSISLKIKNKVDKKAVNLVIKQAVEEFNSYDPKIKKLLKHQLALIKSMRNEKKLAFYYKQQKQMKLKWQKKPEEKESG